MVIWFEQELFRSARRNEIVNRQRNEAEQNDFDTLYDSIDQLQAEIDRLKDRLAKTKHKKDVYIETEMYFIIVYQS